MEKMVLVIYNEAIDYEVMQALKEVGLKNYTKINGILGRGDASGPHLGDDIWPGRNNILFVGCNEKESKELLIKIRVLRERLAKEGVKAFILRIEDAT